MPNVTHDTANRILAELSELREQLSAYDLDIRLFTANLDDLRLKQKACANVVERLEGTFKTLLEQAPHELPPVELKTADGGPPPADGSEREPFRAEEQPLSTEPPPTSEEEVPSPPPETVRVPPPRDPRAEECDHLVEVFRAVHAAAILSTREHVNSMHVAVSKLEKYAATADNALKHGQPAEQVFAECGAECMTLVIDLTKVMFALRPSGSQGPAGSRTDPFRLKLKAALDHLWRHVQSCSPNTYEPFELEARKPVTQQRPRDLSDDRPFHEIKERVSRHGFAPNEVIETVTPGYLQRSSAGGRKVIHPAYVIVAS